MKNNGIKIMSLEGAEILKNNLEDRYIYKNYKGIMDDSLLLRKLKDLKLKVTKNNTTRDVIAVSFNYGYTPLAVEENKQPLEERIEICKAVIKKTRDRIKETNKIKVETKKRVDKEPYKKEIERLKKIIENVNEKIKRLKSEIEEVEKLAINRDSVRDKLYKDGFELTFKNSKMKKEETINYVYWYRTSAKARTGECIFINKNLKKNILEWQRMELELPRNDAKIVEIEAYQSLTSSSISDVITIKPSEILVINDLKSYHELNCEIVDVYTEGNKKGQCWVNNKMNRVENLLFDGQALLDDSLFNAENGMMLLRQRFFKACGFRTYISKFMKNYCDKNGKNYETATIKDRYNNDVPVKNIKMITTENAMKWEKFKDCGASWDLWCKKVEEDNCVFGICKIDHPSKFGNKQRTSYQHLNTLQLSKEDMEELTKDIIKMVDGLKETNNINYSKFLEQNKNEINCNKMILDLVEHNSKFTDTKFFKKYKTKDISNYVNLLRRGKLPLEGDNLTIVGNPYLMLLHSVGEVPNLDNIIVDKEFKDPTLPIANEGNDQYISVYTERFEDGECLASFRNPHNAPNNVGYNKNFKHDLMKEYFNFSKNIMAVNLIQTEEQDLKNGEDQDSDFNFVTNVPIVVKRAKEVFRKFPCIVNNIPPTTKYYNNSINANIEIDNGLAKGKLDIGVSSNLAQLAMSWYWDNPSTKLADIVAIMSVLAQCSIDNAKREYAVNINNEVNRIKKEECMQIKTLVNGKERLAKPYFWKYIKRGTDENVLINTKCPMDLLQIEIDKIESAGNTKNGIELRELIRKLYEDFELDKYKKALEIIKDIDDITKEHFAKEDEDEKSWIKKEVRLYKEAITEIKDLKMKISTMQRLIFYSLAQNTKFTKKILNILYSSNPSKFKKCFKVYKNK